MIHHSIALFFCLPHLLFAQSAPEVSIDVPRDYFHEEEEISQKDRAGD